MNNPSTEEIRADERKRLVDSIMSGEENPLLKEAQARGIPDDIKAVVRAAVEWKAMLKEQGLNTLQTNLGRAVYNLSPESMKMVEE